MFLRQVSLLFLITALVSGLGGNELNGQTIAAGEGHSLALTKEGTVVAWGSNDKNQCNVPSGLKDVVAIAAGRKHSLALTEDGTVVAWGWGNKNQCDVPSGLSYVVAIQAGSKHSLALKQDGTVVAWGSNNSSQCDVPSDLRDVVAIQAGSFHSLALKQDGMVVAWGSNNSSQCDVPSGLRDVVAINAAANHSLALTKDGTVVAWGMNLYYPRNNPIGLRNVVAIQSGNKHYLVLKKDGTVVAWGANDYFQSDVPSGLRDVVAIQAGSFHSLALKKDGTVLAWGWNNYSQCDVPFWQKAALPNTDKISFSSEPPILSLDPSTIQLIDANQTQSLDAFEEALIQFELNNIGPGPGRGVEAEASMTGSIDGITIEQNQSLPTLPSNESIVVSIPLQASRFTEDGHIQVTVEVVEPNGFSPEPFSIEVETRAFLAPKLEVVDFSSTMANWKPNSPVGLDILIQNTGTGLAEDLEVQLTLPSAVNCYSQNTSLQIPSLAPGESTRITYDMIVPRNFNQSNVKATVNLSEKHGDYGTSWTHQFPFEGNNSSGTIIAIESQSSSEALSMDRAYLERVSNSPANIAFNQVPKDIVVTTVAVLPIDGKDCNGQVVSGQDIASFTESSLLGLYNVVERRNLERVLDEQKLALSGLVYEKSAVEAGCNVGAQGIIFTEYGCLTGQETIQLKLVDCQTSELYWSCTGVNATATQTLDKVREELEKE